MPQTLDDGQSEELKKNIWNFSASVSSIEWKISLFSWNVFSFLYVLM